MKTLVAVADRGRFKAFRLIRGRGDSRAHLELLEKSRQEELRTKLSEQLSDSAGRFPRVNGPGTVGTTGMSAGERHSIESEMRRRAMRSLAEEIDALLAGDTYDSCWLAAARPIRRELLDALGAEARAKVKRVLLLNLTKTDPDDVLRHFEAEAGKAGPGIPKKTASLRLQFA